MCGNLSRLKFDEAYFNEVKNQIMIHMIHISLIQDKIFSLNVICMLLLTVCVMLFQKICATVLKIQNKCFIFTVC